MPRRVVFRARRVARLRWLPAVVLLAVTGGCATLSESQCRAGDWHAIGQRDGARGLERARLFQHAEACGKFGAQPDIRAYDAGRRQGLLRYCTARQGYLEGRDGHAYSGVCVGPSEQAFLVGYDHGTAIHEAREALAKVEREIRARQNLLDDEDTSDKDRTRLFRDLRRLQDERRHRADVLARLERQPLPPSWRHQ